MSSIKKLENQNEFVNSSLKSVASDVFKAAADFQAKLNKEVDKKFILKTSDGKAEYISSSYIENKLREMYNGLVQYKNFQTDVRLNEVCGTIEIWVFHPVTGHWLCYTGAAAIQIQMDSGSDFTDLRNKKQNALMLGFPKLKTECIKNAAKLIGNVFGANLNRKQIDNDYEADIYNDEDEFLKIEITELLKRAKISDTEKTTIEKMLSNSTFNRLLTTKNYLNGKL